MKYPSRTNTARLGILIFSVFFVVGQNPETELKLRKDLFSKHSSDIRPVKNISHAVQINADLELYAINRFDTVNGVLITQCSMEFSWYDEFLSWDPNEYANISMLYVSAREIWKPIILICNAVTAQLIDNGASNLVLHSDGRVVLWYQEILRTFCTIDAHGYPFDKQRCHILICVAIHKAEHTVFRQLYYHKAPFFKNYQWDVQVGGIRNSEDNSGRSMARATLLITRNIKVTTIALMVPSAIFTVVSVFVFLLPAESGEKVSLATTLFLSVIVYLVEIDKVTPKNSETMPLLTVYLLTLTALGGFNTIGAILECRIFIMQQRKRPCSCDNQEASAASSKKKSCHIKDTDQDHIRSIETEMENYVSKTDFSSSLGKENLPKIVVNSEQHKTKHQRLSKIFFGISVIYIIISIITIFIANTLLTED